MASLKNHKWLRSSTFLIIIIAFFVAMLLFQGFASWVGTFVADLFSYNDIDPYNIYANAFVHHVVQMLIPLAIIIILGLVYKNDFYFKIGDKATGIKHVVILSIFMMIHSIVFYYLLYSANPYEGYKYPLDALNVIGKLGLEYGITGPSEEVLFRALPIGLFAIIFKKSVPLKWGITLENVVAAILFTLAHGNYLVTHNYYFIGYTFILGIIFGITYQKTRSIIYPMMMHSMTNMMMTGTSFLFAAFYK